jgi:hypothetical protein
MNDHLAIRRRGMAGCALALLLCLGGAQAADSGPRHHAEGAYDAATATYTGVRPCHDVPQQAHSAPN